MCSWMYHSGLLNSYSSHRTPLAAQQTMRRKAAQRATFAAVTRVSSRSLNLTFVPRFRYRLQRPRKPRPDVLDLYALGAVLHGKPNQTSSSVVLVELLGQLLRAFHGADVHGQPRRPWPASFCSAINGERRRSLLDGRGRRSRRDCAHLHDDRRPRRRAATLLVVDLDQLRLRELVLRLDHAGVLDEEAACSPTARHEPRGRAALGCYSARRRAAPSGTCLPADPPSSSATSNLK